MKNSFCIILSILLILGVHSLAFADNATSEVIEFAPVFTNVFGFSASDWFASSYNRAVFTTTIVIDLGLELNSDELFDHLTNDSYVGKVDSLLTLYLDAGDDDYIIAYDAREQEAQALYYTDMSNSVLKLVAEDACSDGFYLNNVSDIYKAVADTADFLDSVL